MFNITEALAYLDATIHNHLTDLNTELRVQYDGPMNYSAELGDPNARDPHCRIYNAPSIDEALIRLACAVREETDIGAH